MSVIYGPSPSEAPRDFSDDELLAAAQGCTELTCPYHDSINAELRRRNISRWARE